VNGSGAAFWSWFEPSTAHYFPQHAELPKLDFVNTPYGGLPALRATLTSRYGALKTALATNAPGTGPWGIDLPGGHYGSTTQLGWARPLGSNDGLEPGGPGIQFIDGERAIAATSLDGFRYLQLLHRMHAERQANAMWRADGQPSYQDQWLYTDAGCTTCPQGPSGLPSKSSISFYMDEGASEMRFRSPAVPNWIQNQDVVNFAKQPAYDGPGFWEYWLPGYFSPWNLNGFQPHASSHLVRYFGFPMAVAYISNDPLAKDDVLAQAEMARTTFTEYPNSGFNHSSSIYSIIHSPGDGVAAQPGCASPNLGRQQGWMVDVGVGAYALGDPNYRARTKVWFDRTGAVLTRALKVVNDVSFPYTYGILGRKYTDGNWYFPTCGGANCYFGTQSWEEMILQNATRGILTSVLPSGDPLITALQTTLNRMHMATVSPVFWNEAGKTIWGKIPFSSYSSPCNVYDADVGGVGTNPLPFQPNGTEAIWYLGNSLAQAYLDTADNLFLQKAWESVSAGGACTTGCGAAITGRLQLDLDPTNIANWSYTSNYNVLLGLVQ
jgi:hypothetical protein